MGDYSRIVERDADGLYTATHPELLGCRGQGVTPDEAIADLDECRALYLEALAAAGVPAHAPFVLRPVNGVVTWNPGRSCASSSS